MHANTGKTGKLLTVGGIELRTFSTVLTTVPPSNEVKEKMHRFSYSNSKKLQKLKVLTKTRSYVLCHVQPMHTAHTLRVQQKTDTQKNKKNMLSDKQCCVFHCFWCSYVCSCKITVPPNSFTN